MRPVLLGLVLLCCGALAEEPLSQPTAAEGLAVFLDAAHRGDFTHAAACLDLDHVPAAERAVEGPRLARRLMFLVDQHLSLDAEELSTQDAPLVKLGTVKLGSRDVPIELLHRRGGNPPWVFSGRTVSAVDPLFSEHGSALWELVPTFLMNGTFGALGLWQWLGLLALLVLTWLFARVVTTGTTRALLRLTHLTANQLDDHIVTALRGPSRAILFLLIFSLGSRSLAFPPAAQTGVDDLARSLAVAALVWALLITSRLVAHALELRSTKEADAFTGRAVKTQVRVLRRVFDVIILVVGGALVLLQFSSVRHIGMSMLASAGVAGVVLGLAAQKSISNLLAGIQISLTQPIRIGDSVMVEGESGTVEEITLTYVVVKVWDLRRLVLPISTFLEKPFQNWTRGSTALLGTVEVFADYTVDVAAARAELSRILEPEKGGLWDGKEHGLQVTAVTAQAMTLRALVSAEDAGRLWELRCKVREALVSWLKKQPGGLPVTRSVELRPSA